MVVELGAEGPRSYAGTPPLTLGQEGELNCDICVHPHTGKVAEPFFLTRYYPATEDANTSILIQ